jgi:hypothetical protein
LSTNEFNKPNGVSYLSNFSKPPSTNIMSAPSIINAGKTYQYVDNGEPMRGGMKDVYFAPDKSYVVAFTAISRTTTQGSG